jgi:MFS family permease
LLFGAMFNLTLVVAGLKELVIDELGGTVRDATLFFSIETVAYILFAPVWGLASDRMGRRKVLVVLGFALSSLIYAAYEHVTTVPMLLTLRFVQGACSVMGWSIVMAIMVDHPDRERSGRFMGLMGAALILGVGVGAPAGGYLTRWFGARAPLQAAAILFALLALLALWLREPAQLQRGVRVRRIVRALTERPRLLLPMLFHFVDRLAVGLFVVVFPLYLDTLGAGDAAVRGRYLSFFLIPFALLQIFTGRLAERTGPYWPLILGSLAYGSVLTLVGRADLLLLWPVMLALGVFAAVMFPPAMLLTAQLATPESRGSAMGAFNQAGSLGFAVGPLVGAWAYEARGFGFAFALVGVLEIAIAVAVAAWWWSRRDG